MNPYDGPDGEGLRPDEDFGTDMITMNPPRWQRWRPGRPIAVAGVAAVALAAGGGVGYAATHSGARPAADTAAVSSTPSPTPSAVAPDQGAGHGWRGGFPGGIPGGPTRFARGPVGAGLIHGEFTVPKPGGGYQTVDVQMGTVTAVSSTSVTVKSADGYSVTYTVTSKSVVDAQAAGIGSVKKGDSVFITATVSGSTPTAATIIDMTAVKAGRSSFGFRAAPPKPPSAQVQGVQAPWHPSA